VRIRALESAIQAIAADNRTGASTLCLQAAEALISFAESADEDEFASETPRAAVALAHAQPAMAPLFRLANDVLLAAPDRRRVVDACRAFAARVNGSDAVIARTAQTLVPASGVILTHSFSRTVLTTLLAAHRNGKHPRVVATESRPVGEGLALARTLADAGMEAVLIVDAAAGRWIADTTVILVGADAVADDGVVNKIGTSLIARAAAACGRPVYSLCSTEKLAPAGFRHRDAARPAQEVGRDIPRNVTVWNYYFDSTPLDLFSGIVTEEGILKPEDVRRRMAQIEVHAALRPMLDSEPAPS
jgi:translation initiation factor 2B subunit (eIF-2B alpha/beta/delta family)